MVAVAKTLKTSRGLELRFPPDDFQIAYRVEHEGFWEEPVALAIEKFLKPAWTMLDLGANVGYFTTIAARQCQKVIAVEADPEALHLLDENLNANGLADRVDVWRYAASDKAGPAYLGGEREGMPGTRHLALDGIAVDTLTLTQILGDERPQFIKADIEGAEYRVFSCAPEVLDAAEVIVLEVGSTSREYGNSPDDVVKLLEAHDFTVTDMEGRLLPEHWVEQMEAVPDGYMNLLAQKHPKAAVAPADILLCVWRDPSRETKQCIDMMLQRGWGFREVAGDALIPRSRARAVSHWYENADDDVFLMVDGDIVFAPEHAEAVVALAREKRSIACGAYPVRDGGHLACRRYPGQQINFGPDQEPVEIIYPATGFMAVHRDVIAALINAKKADGEPLFPYCDAFGIEALWPFFDTFPYRHDDGKYESLSEDYAFGEHARRLGFATWLDPSVILFHMGMYPYTIENMRGAVRVDPEAH